MLPHSLGHEECVPAAREHYPPYCRECIYKAQQGNSNNEPTARWCSSLIRGTYYCTCQFTMNHFKLLVPDKGIKFYLVISIETKEFAELFSIWLLNHILLNVTFKIQHWFSKTWNWKQEDPDERKWLIINCHSILITWYLKIKLMCLLLPRLKKRNVPICMYS